MINKELAKAIVHKLGSYGTPPEFGLEFYTVGLGKYLTVIEEEYFKDYLKLKLSSFKLIVGNYGGGKTHFLYCLRKKAMENNYLTSYVSLSPVECPFDKLELVYKVIALNLMAPKTSEDISFDTFYYERGIDNVIKLWYQKIKEKVLKKEDFYNYLEGLSGVESISYLNALKGSFEALVREDYESFENLIQYLKGEEITKDIRGKYRISERLDKSTAFRFIRSLAQWGHLIGYNGLVLFFDEAERGLSISSSRDKRRALDNLRQIIDECGNARLPGVMFFYAVTDENLILEGSGGVYEALKQRLRSTFTATNPTGVKINLEAIEKKPEEFLYELGLKLARLFEIAYDITFNDKILKATIEVLSKACLTTFALDISFRRLFVLGIIEAFFRLKERNFKSPLSQKEAEEILKTSLKKIEEEKEKEIESEEF
ncbi:MAG: ATP-binding protein [candidate division WOR-3 bacterium]|nr:ATP-binding protein [candidate division WOR-3 bacterium]MCX7837449.1 ATP-binding protein [candidate division WOR-3 bacterium]MDW8113617.1 DUF2791 family P-loop domain-containing protein [candidate division WOR-3 bacterium]